MTRHLDKLLIGTLVPTLTCSQEQIALCEVLLVRQRGCVAGIGVSGLHLVRQSSSL